MSVSGLDYTLIAFILFYFFWKFQRIFKESENEISRLLSFLVLFLALSFSGIGLTGIFFPLKQLLLEITLFFTVFFQTIAFSFSGQLFFYLKVKKYSSRSGFLLFFLLGLIPVFLEIIFPSRPQLTLLGFINWNIQPLVAWSRTLLIVLAVFPVGLDFLIRLKLEKGIIFWKTLFFDIGFILAGFSGILILLSKTFIGELGLVLSMIICFSLSGLKEIDVAKFTH